MRHKPAVVIICFVLLNLIILISISSCAPCEDGYKHFRTEKGIARFSFEYPCDWRITKNEITQDHTEVYLVAPRIRKGNISVSSTFFHVSINKLKNSDPKLEDLLDERLSFLKELFSSFELIDRSPTEINSVIGVQIHYFYFTLPVAPAGEPDSHSEPMFARDIYFNYKGLVWNISIISHKEIAKVHNIYVEHILETFQFLD